MVSAMSRPRIQIPNGIYHVGTRGNRRQPIYLDAADRVRFLGFLGDVVVRLGWRCHAYCLMTNHYHVLVTTPNPDISVGMEYLNGRYAKRFNARHGYEGHLFERRFYSEVVEGDVHLLELARYIVLNPVRTRICANAGDWPWSSYNALVGRARPPRLLATKWLLSMFSSDRRRARDLYAISSHRARAPLPAAADCLERPCADAWQRDTARRPAAAARTRRPAGVSASQATGHAGFGGASHQPKPYAPAKRVASRRTSSAAGSPTTFR